MDFKKLMQPHLKNVKPYVPGKPVEELRRERNIAGEIIKLASNENPFGPAETVLAVLKKGIRELNRYPDDSAYYLHQSLARYHEISERRIFIGNGSVEILYFLATLFVGRGDNLIYATPSFVIYDIVSKLSLGEGRPIPCDEDFRHDLKSMSAAVDAKTKLVFICNPNNPTGTMIPEGEVGRLADGLPRRVLLVLLHLRPAD